MWISEELNYDEGPLLDVVMACRRFIAEIEGLPVAAVTLMLPALGQHLEDRLAMEMMHGREVQLGRELTPKECDQEAAFVEAELLRGEGEAQERMPDLLHMLRLDTLVVDEDPREMQREERKDLFPSWSRQGVARQRHPGQPKFLGRNGGGEIGVDARLLIVSYLQGICMHHILTEELDRRKEELGRRPTNEALGQALDQVTRQRNAIERLAKAQGDEIEALVEQLGTQAQRYSSPLHLHYIA